MVVLMLEINNTFETFVKLASNEFIHYEVKITGFDTCIVEVSYNGSRIAEASAKVTDTNKISKAKMLGCQTCFTGAGLPEMEYTEIKYESTYLKNYRRSLGVSAVDGLTLLVDDIKKITSLGFRDALIFVTQNKTLV